MIPARTAGPDITGVSSTSWSSNSRPTRSASRALGAQQPLEHPVGDQRARAGDRPRAALQPLPAARPRRRSRGCRGTAGRGSPRTSRAPKSMSRSTTSWPSARSMSAVPSQRAADVRATDGRACRAGNAAETAMRRRAGRDRAASSNGRGLATVGRTGRARRASSAVSSTERVSGPKTIQWLPSRSCGARGTRPRLRLEPEQAAARRRDPDRAGAVRGQRGRHDARPRPRPPSRRSSRPACARGPTGCGSRPT